MAIRNAEKILSSRSMHVNTVFKILIEERYEKTTLCLSDLLEWKLWPCLIKHFGEFHMYSFFLRPYCPAVHTCRFTCENRLTYIGI